MIDLIKREVLGTITFAKKVLKVKVQKMETLSTQENLNKSKMINPEVKRKSSLVQDPFQKPKYRKKKKKGKDDNLPKDQENRPYTWFLALPSKHKIIIWRSVTIKFKTISFLRYIIDFSFCFSIR